MHSCHRERGKNPRDEIKDSQSHLVVRKNMKDESLISDIVMDRADQCAELRGLEPSRREFAYGVRSIAHEVMRHRISQNSWKTLQEKDSELGRRLAC